MKFNDIPVFSYPLHFQPVNDTNEGGYYLVTSRDFPPLITDGSTIEEARINGADALDEVIAGAISKYVQSGGVIPKEYDQRQAWLFLITMKVLPPVSLCFDDEEYVMAKCDGVENAPGEDDGPLSEEQLQAIRSASPATNTPDENFTQRLF